MRFLLLFISQRTPKGTSTAAACLRNCAPLQGLQRRAGATADQGSDTARFAGGEDLFEVRGVPRSAVASMRWHGLSTWTLPGWSR
jgi:hypothetical protein